MKPSNIITLALCIAIPMVSGAISGVATTANLPVWYASLVKPGFSPPNYLFGPVWTSLYLVMGIGLYRIWISAEGRLRKTALIVFYVQLACNVAWSFIFFHFRQIGWAFVDIVLVWAGVASMIAVFARIDKPATVLQIPYLLWVSFAAVLNAAIWKLN